MNTATHYALCLQPYIPMRATASERSEMVNQLLFGDTFRVVETVPHWHRVMRDADSYEGWIDSKTAVPLTEVDYRRYLLATPAAPMLRMPYTPVQVTAGGVTNGAFLPWGCRIFNVDDTGITFRMQDMRFDVASTAYVNPFRADKTPRAACAKYLLQQAQLLLNVPYLWGGCSAFGLDCSGFTQTLYRFVGIVLPRDARQQASCGAATTYDERQAGDLAFFGEGDRVTHVGVVAEKGQILHVSGYLHYDELRPEGIYSRPHDSLTHHLLCIRHLF